MVVRQDWLSAEGSEAKDETVGLNLQGLRVEALLVRLALGEVDTRLTQDQYENAMVPFPYMTEFVTAARDGYGLAQHWSMLDAGPEGFLIGRIGLSRWVDFGILAQVSQCPSIPSIPYRLTKFAVAPKTDDSQPLDKQRADPIKSAARYVRSTKRRRRRDGRGRGPDVW
jgi:hypothetical protein